MTTPSQKLTVTQKKVIDVLNSGGFFITSSEMKGADVCYPNSKEWFHINGGVFWRMVNDGIIYRTLEYPFDYILTKNYRK